MSEDHVTLISMSFSYGGHPNPTPYPEPGQAPGMAGVPGGPYFPTGYPPYAYPPAAAYGYPSSGYPPYGYPPAGYPPYGYPPTPQPQPKLFLPTKLKDSMRFFQVPARRWWWGLIALAVYVVCYLIVMFGSSFIMLAVDPSILETAGNGGEIPTTPSLFLVNNLAIAMDIGVCTLLSWVFFRQGFGWLVSVTGRFRWKWMGIALGIFAIGYAVEMIVEIFISGAADYGLTDLTIEPYTVFMLLSILVTTPFQCAGEEFQSRAFLGRIVAAIIPFRVPGLILSALIPSVVFMWLHDAQDPWLNLNYFCVALMMWWLAYRTGGIEASIALHFVNNIFSEWMLPFTDISGMFDRSEGTGSPVILVYLAVQLVLVLIVDWVARQRGVVRMSAPAAAVPVVVKPRKFVTIIEGSIVPATKDDLPRISTTVWETLVIPPEPPVVLPPVPVIQPPVPVILPQAGSPYQPQSPTPVILPEAGSPPSYGSDSIPVVSSQTGSPTQYPQPTVLPESPSQSGFGQAPVPPPAKPAPPPSTGPRRAWIDDH